MMDEETRRLFQEHVRAIESLAISGDLFSVKTLACMALINGAANPEDPGSGGEDIINLRAWRTRLAA